MDHQSPPRLSDNQNEDHEKRFTDSIDSGFNDYSDGLLQQAESDNVNSHINRSPTSDGILRMSYENMVLSQSEQQSMPQTHQVPWVQCSPSHSVHSSHILQDVGNINGDHGIPTMQCSPLRSVPVQQLQHEQTLQHPTIQQCTRNSTSTNNQHQNSKYHYDELFKIEISGIEIVVRRKLTDLNLEMQGERNIQPQQTQQNGKCCPTLKNQTKRNQSRMHPYRMPIDQNKLINTRDNDHCSCCPNISQVVKQQK